jgi:hypothetical protein
MLDNESSIHFAIKKTLFDIIEYESHIWEGGTINEMQ